MLFAYEQEPTPYIPMPNKGRAIGLDYSSPDFYVDSDGKRRGPAFLPDYGGKAGPRATPAVQNDKGLQQLRQAKN
ncbi:transposase [Lawsonibacter asaccharolyticus]|nr:transposase [Lawsonibacter asaccharolyticus]